MTFAGRLEAEFPGFKSLLVSSGTCAIYLALRSVHAAVGGGEVLLPSTICPSVPFAVVWAGFTPRFCDVELDTFCMSERTIREALEKGSKGAVRAAIFVYLFGKSFPAQAIAESLKASGIAIIEDFCQSIGTRLPAEGLGDLGDYSILSFNEKKILKAATGGAVLARRPSELARMADDYKALPERPSEERHRALGASYHLSTHGWFSKARASGFGIVLPFSEEWIASLRELFLFRLTNELDESALAAEWDGLAAERERRHRNYSLYERCFKPEVPFVQFSPSEICWRLPLVMRTAQDARETVEFVRARGALISDHYFPVSMLFGDRSCVNAERIGACAVNLWVDCKLDADDVPWICEEINRRCREGEDE